MRQRGASNAMKTGHRGFDLDNDEAGAVGSLINARASTPPESARVSCTLAEHLQAPVCQATEVKAISSVQYLLCMVGSAQAARRSQAAGRAQQTRSQSVRANVWKSTVLIALMFVIVGMPSEPATGSVLTAEIGLPRCWLMFWRREHAI